MTPPNNIESLLCQSLDVWEIRSKNSSNEDEVSATPKRRRDSSMNESTGSVNNNERPLKSLRREGTSGKPQTRGVINIADLVRKSSPVKVEQPQIGDQLDVSRTDENVLTDKQKEFLHQWYEGFARYSFESLSSHESLNALATLIQVRPQYVFEYVSKKYINTTDELPKDQTPASASTQDQPSSPCAEPYSLTKSNNHLPPATLTLVEKYISTCHRCRPPNDGRRTVNSGPFRCTFGCGYRTKRAFDWRRHEETHEPQELWLCTLCCQVKDDTQTLKDLHTPSQFLVSRKDKFLRHVKDAHQKWVPERVLEMSRVGYKPMTQGTCETCGGGWEGWDERCKHVLGHFEDEMEMSIKREDGCRNVAKSGLSESASSEAGDKGDQMAILQTR